MAKKTVKHPPFIRVGGVLYRRKDNAADTKTAMKDPGVSSALSLLSAAKNKFDSASEAEEVAQAKAELAEAAKNLLDAVS